MASRLMVTLAHLGGIDEIGVFVIPAVAALLVLRWVERRAKRGDDGDSEPVEETSRVD